MVTLNENFVGAGLKDAYVKDSDGNKYDIKAVIEASGDPAQDEVEIKGDDTKLATFIFNKGEDLSIKANGVDFDTFQAITGNTGGSNANSTYLPLGTDEEENPPYVEIGTEADAKDADGNAKTVRKVWHKVQIISCKISMAGESEVNLEIIGKAYKTSEDIEGGALQSERIATLTLAS